MPRLPRLLAAAAAILLAVGGAAHADSGYKKGFFIASEDGAQSYALTINGVFQPRFGYTANDGADDAFAFQIARARLGVKGHVLTKDLGYKLLVDFGKGDAILMDLFVDYALAPGAHVRVGQWKRPLSRQFLSSSTRLQLVDRAITDKAFGVGRDIGLAVHNDYEKSPELEWVVGLFNGTGEKPRYSVSVDGNGDITSVTRTNVPSQLRPVAVARIGYNLGDMAGGEGYGESDLSPGKGLRFGVAASGLVDFGLDDDAGAIVADVDFILKVSGFAASGAFFLRSRTGDDSGLDALGFNVQAGYVIGGKVEPAVRFARVMPDDEGDATLQELTFSVSVYFLGQTLKWSTEVAALGEEVGDASTTDVRLTSQLQTFF